MPRSQGTSRKGKPKKHDRAAGVGRSLQKSGRKKHTPSASLGGMAMRKGVESIGVEGPDGTAGAGASGLAATGGPHVDNRASVLDVNDLDDFLIQAEMANREFVSEKEGLVVIDETAQAATTAVASAASLDILDEDEHYGRSRGVASQTAPTFAFQELSVPRRPKWDETTTASDLDKMEKESFLNWRRAIAQKEEEILYGDDENKNSSIKSLGVTPFEKNIEIWRQLWRVMERCSCIVQIVDARNPLFYLSKDLKRYATEELGRPMLLLVNKSDYLTAAQRKAWHEYLSDPGEKGDGAWEHVFFSAYDEQQKLDRAAADERHQDDDDDEDDGGNAIAATSGNQFNTLEDMFDDDSTVDDEDQVETESSKSENKQSTSAPAMGSTTGMTSTSDIGIENPLTRDQLLDWLHSFATKNECAEDPKYNRIPFGMVGFPNVGKSSVINVLMGNAKHTHGVVRVGVASQPGKTKHFQTLLLPDRNDMLLCDCPGLVFPSFVSNTADLIAAGVYPIAQMRDPWPTMNLLCRRIPRQVLNAQYGIEIPMPTADAMLEAREGEIPPPTAEEFLTSYCNARSMLAAGSGIPDFQRASRIIIKEYADGKLLYCHSPPEGATSTLTEREFQKETLVNALRKTKKLRDKLTVSQDYVAHTGVGADVDSDGDDSELEDPAIDEDEMLLELMGGMSATPSSTGLNKGDSSKTSGRTKKWGKKGRKARNKDPYGCHSTPDDMLADGGVPVGLSVKSGNKKNRKSGYTRGGIRAVC